MSCGTKQYLEGSKIKNKLCSGSGESIAETLVSLLVSSLALTMLAAAISTASGIVKKSRNKLEKYQTNNEIIVTIPSSLPDDHPETITSYSNKTISLNEISNPGDPYKFELSVPGIMCYENHEFANRTPTIIYKKK